MNPSTPPTSLFFLVFPGLCLLRVCGLCGVRHLTRDGDKTRTQDVDDVLMPAKARDACAALH